MMVGGDCDGGDRFYYGGSGNCGDGDEMEQSIPDIIDDGQKINPVVSSGFYTSEIRIHCVRCD